MQVEILSPAAQLYEKSQLKRFTIGEWTWRSLKVIRIAIILYTVPVYHFLLVVCSNYVFILHYLWDITTFTIYMKKWLKFRKILCTVDKVIAI